MGHFHSCLSPRMIRVVTLLCLVALALGDAAPDAEPTADADPWVLGYGLGHGHGYGLYGYGGLYGGHGYYSGLHGLWGRKRRSADAAPVPDADADANADPYVLYGGHLGGYYGGYPGYYGYGLGHYRYGLWGR